MMARLYVLCEGYTERTFVANLLVPHLEKLGIHASASIVTTRQNPRGPDDKGGFVPLARVVNELRVLLNDRGAYATSLFDYYGFPGGPYANEQEVERHLAAEVAAGARFIPYVQKHEFEALVLADPAVTAATLGGAAKGAKIREWLAECGEPENVNLEPGKAPSKRLRQLFPSYDKVLHGPSILKRVGIAAVRNRCPRFDGWLSRLEALGPA